MAARFIRFFVLSLMVLFLCRILTTGISAQADEIPQWSLFELTLIAEQDYSNPYNQVSLIANFSGPAGRQKTIRGFWDGGNSFKVRFNPDIQGTWSYSTFSVPADAGLTKTGSIQVGQPVTGSRGFLRRDPDSPYHFKFDNNQHFLMFGTTYYSLILKALDNDNWAEAVDQIGKYGINKVRLLVYPWGKTKYPDSEPFSDQEHDRLNLSHWQKLDQVINYLDTKGIIADLIIFADSERQYTGTWEKEARYVRYVISRYAAYPNVIWCLCNEWEFAQSDTDGYADKDFWDQVGNLIKSEDPWMTESGAYRLLSIHNKNQGEVPFKFFDSGWPTHVCLQHGFNDGDQAGFFAVTNNWGHSLPVVIDEYGYIGNDWGISRDDARRGIWATYLAGGYATTGDFHRQDGSLANPYEEWTDACWNCGDWYDAVPEYRDIKYLTDFWNSIENGYWQMNRQDSLITSGERIYATGTNGQEYVIYAASGGSLSLRLPAGEFRFFRYNPRDGSTTQVEDLTGDGIRQLDLPDNQDWVLHLILIKPTFLQVLSSWLTTFFDQNNDGKVNGLDFCRLIR